MDGSEGEDMFERKNAHERMGIEMRISMGVEDISGPAQSASWARRRSGGE